MNIKKTVLFTGLSCLIGLPLALSKEPPKDRISMEEAQKKAIEVYSGNIESKELEHEHGKWIYSFDIRPEKGGEIIHEVQIDARSGKLVSHTTENAKKEAQEASQEKTEKKKAK